MIEIYTSFGDESGKGKTTAAIGLAIRAAGSGKKVVWIAFDKGGDNYGEDRIFEKIGIECIRTGRDRRLADGRFDFSVTEEDHSEAQRGFEAAKKAIESADLLMMDEVVGVVSLGLISEEELLEFLAPYKGNPEKEVVLTGRNATDRLIKTADLVTEMRKKKHYFDEGVVARRGIEF